MPCGKDHSRPGWSSCADSALASPTLRIGRTAGSQRSPADGDDKDLQGKVDLIAFGRKFLANPDLQERFRQHAALNADDPSTYYGGGPKGYTDYPTLAQKIGEEPKPCLDDRWR